MFSSSLCSMEPCLVFPLPLLASLGLFFVVHSRYFELIVLLGELHVTLLSIWFAPMHYSCVNNMFWNTPGGALMLMALDIIPFLLRASFHFFCFSFRNSSCHFRVVINRDGTRSPVLRLCNSYWSREVGGLQLSINF